MIITNRNIELLNRRLVDVTIGSKSAIGYNRTDFKYNQELFYGLQRVDLLKILGDLYKYAGKDFLLVDNKTLTLDDIRETYDYLNSQNIDYNRESGISFVVREVNGETTLEVHSIYSPKLEELLPYVKQYVTYKKYSSEYPGHDALKYKSFAVISQSGIKSFASRAFPLLEDRGFLKECIANIKEPEPFFEVDKDYSRDTGYQRVKILTNKMDIARSLALDCKAYVATGPNFFRYSIEDTEEILERLNYVEEFKKYGQDCAVRMKEVVVYGTLAIYEKMLLNGEYFLIQPKTEEQIQANKLLIEKYSPVNNGESTDLEIYIEQFSRDIISVKTLNETFKTMILNVSDNYNTGDYIRISKRKFTTIYKTMIALGYQVTGISQKELASHIGLENVVIRDSSKKEEIVVYATFRIVRFAYKYNTSLDGILRNYQSHVFDVENRHHEINILELKDLLEEIDKRNIVGSELNHLDYEPLRSVQKGYESMVEKYSSIPLFDYSRLKVKPFNHQISGAEFIIKQRGALLCDEMGLGKTKTSLIAARSVLDSPILAKNTNRIALIICPNTVKLNWSKEILKVDPHDKILVMVAGQSFDASMLIQNGRPVYKYIIINYDIMDRYGDEILKLRPAVLIVDEAHRCTAINNDGKPDSQRAQHLVNISETMPFVWLLTGTPFRNKAIELFNLLVMINHPIALNFRTFGAKYSGGNKTQKGYTYKGFTKAEELNNKLNERMIRRRKKDLKNKGNALLDLPDKIRNFFPVEIDKKAYDNAVNIFMANCNASSPWTEMLVLMGALKKYLSYEKIKHTYEITTAILSEKEDTSPVVIFSDYKKPLNELQEMFESKGITCCRITGSEDEFEKQASVDDFAKGKYQVALCSIKAAGVGTTLTRAKHLIFNDLTWVPFDHFQSEDRIHRVGQDEEVTIYYMYCENADIDLKLAQKLEQKAEEFDAVVDGGLGETFTVSVMSEVYKDFKRTHGISDNITQSMVSKSSVNNINDSVAVDTLVDMARGGKTPAKKKSKLQADPAMAALLAYENAKQAPREIVKPKPIEETIDPIVQLKSMFSNGLDALEKVYRVVNLTETKTIYEVALVDKKAAIILTYRVYTDSLYDLPVSKVELFRITKTSKSVIHFNALSHARIMNEGSKYDKVMAKVLATVSNQEKYANDIKTLLDYFSKNPDVKVITPAM